MPVYYYYYYTKLQAGTFKTQIKITHSRLKTVPKQDVSPTPVYNTTALITEFHYSIQQMQQQDADADADAATVPSAAEEVKNTWHNPTL